MKKFAGFFFKSLLVTLVVIIIQSILKIEEIFIFAPIGVGWLFVKTYAKDSTISLPKKFLYALGGIIAVLGTIIAIAAIGFFLLNFVFQNTICSLLEADMVLKVMLFPFWVLCL